MFRPIAKYVVRVTIFASAVTALACATPTAPAPVNAKKPATKDYVDDTLLCRNGYTIEAGRYVCNAQ